MTRRAKVCFIVPWVLCIGCGSTTKPNAEAPPAPKQAEPASKLAPVEPSRVGSAESASSARQDLENRARLDAAVRFDGVVFHDPNENPMVTACVPSGPELCGDGIDNDCDGRYDDTGCSYASGILQWTLTWASDADLNLVVYAPAGDSVSPDRPRAAASRLTMDRACNGKCAPSNVENAFVAFDGPPVSGTYQASVEVNRAASSTVKQPIHARLSGRVGKTTWHTDITLAPFAGAEYRTAFVVGADSDADGVLDEQDMCPREQGCWFTNVKYRGCADRDLDGVPDQIDACPDKAGFDSDDPKRHGCPVEFGDAWVTNDGVKILKRIEFSTGTAELRPESLKIIKDVARAIQSRPGAVTRMAIDGHTDDQGDETANVDLSFRRAAAVATELVARGVPAELLDARGYGQTKPLAVNDTDAGKQANRRVEFVILQPPPKSGRCWFSGRTR